MRMHGDLDWMDAQHFRNAFRSQLLQGRFGVGDFLSKVGSHVFSTKAVEQAFFGGLSRTSQHVGLLFAYRPLGVRNRRISNQKELVKALSDLVGRMPPLHLVYLPWEELTMLDQVRLSMDFADILVQPFGAGMVWSLFLPRGSYVIELQQDADATAHFVGCFKADISLASKGVIGAPSPWDPPTNLYSEWGSWAFRNKINFACVSKRPTLKHCDRNYLPQQWDTPWIDVDIDTVTTLIADAARRLLDARNRSHRIVSLT